MCSYLLIYLSQYALNAILLLSYFLACVHMKRAAVEPTVMTEVNVDRSKPCSFSVLVSLLTGYLLFLFEAASSEIPAGSVLWVQPALKQTHPQWFGCRDVFPSVDESSLPFCMFFFLLCG